MERPRWVVHIDWVGTMAEDHLSLENPPLLQQAVNMPLEASNPSSHLPVVIIKNISSYATCSLWGAKLPLS